MPCKIHERLLSSCTNTCLVPSVLTFTVVCRPTRLVNAMNGRNLSVFADQEHLWQLVFPSVICYISLFSVQICHGTGNAEYHVFAQIGYFRLHVWY
jgi:hypothetical protein